MVRPMRISNRRIIEIGALLLVLMPPVLVIAIKGDPLFVGAWYYLAAPVVVISAAALVQPQIWLLIGIALGSSLSFLAYQWVQLTAQRVEGLLGLGHLFSVSGALIAALAIAYISRRRNWEDPRGLFVAGLVAWAVGFVIAQVIVCNTVFYCGGILSPLSQLN
jgi:hypothetical protein